MPCYYNGSAEADALMAADEARAAMTKVTQMLCSVLHYIESNDYTANSVDLFEEHPEIEEFWKEHKAIDEKRQQAEVEAIMNRLTPAEIKLLKKRGVMK